MNLVTTDADQVYARMAQWIDILAVALRGVHVQVSRVAAEKGGDGGDGLAHASLVVHLHHTDQQSVRPQRFANRLGIDLSRGFRTDPRDTEAPVLHGLNRTEDGMVLDGCRHDMHLSG